MTLANKITILRILLIPPFIISILFNKILLATIIFVLSVLTDWFDGFIARIKKQKTPLGCVLDPLADKLLLISSFWVLSYLKKFPLWIFVIIFSRDLILLIGWLITYLLTNNYYVYPRIFGKLTTFFQMAVIFLTLIEINQKIFHYATISMLLVTVISTLDYIWAGSKRLNI